MAHVAALASKLDHGLGSDIPVVALSFGSPFNGDEGLVETREWLVRVAKREALGAVEESALALDSSEKAFLEWIVDDTNDWNLLDDECKRNTNILTKSR